MIIHKEQMQAFSESRKEAFVQRMVRHLRDDFVYERERRRIAEENIEPLVRHGVMEAGCYGVVYEDDVEFFIDCMVLLGPGFDCKTEWAREILQDGRIDGSAKMAQIEQHMLFGGDGPL